MNKFAVLSILGRISAKLTGGGGGELIYILKGQLDLFFFKKRGVGFLYLL